MIVTNNENFDFTLISVIENSAYNYEDKKIFFKGRPANRQEKKNYRVQQGVNATADGIYIISSNLPENIKPGDQVTYLNKPMIVESVGYYYDQNRIVNASFFSEEYIMAQCPKGITLG